MNAPTAALALLLDNDQNALTNICNAIRALRQDHTPPAYMTPEEFLRIRLKDVLVSYARAASDFVEATGADDELRYHVAVAATQHFEASVDWPELARHYIQKEEEGAA